MTFEVPSIALARFVGLRRAPGIPAAAGGQSGVGQRFHAYAIDRAGRQAQGAAGAPVFDDGVHALGNTGDRVHRAGLNAQGAADAQGRVDHGALARAFRSAGWVERGSRALQQMSKFFNTLRAAGRAAVDVGLAFGDGLRVGGTVGVAAAGALRLRQQGVDLRGQGDGRNGHESTGSGGGVGSRRFARRIARSPLRMRGDEIAHDGIDLFAPAPSRKNAVMPRAFCHVMLTADRSDAGAQVVRRLGLPRAGNIVELAFDGEQRRAVDVLRAHRLAFHRPGAVDQSEVLEHQLDGVEVVIGVHVEHGVVLVVKTAMRLGIIVVAADQVEKVVVVRGEVAVGVHRHETAVLQKAGIDTPTRAGVVGGHAVDHIVLEPLIALVHRQVVHRRGRLARVDGAAHHDHAARRDLARTGHERNGTQHRHRGLADRHHMHIGADGGNELADVGNIVIQAETALLGGHHASVGPVGDEHLVILQHGFHCVAQQGGMMARQRRHDEHGRIILELAQQADVVRKPLEPQQTTERLFQHDPLLHCDSLALDLHAIDAELGFFVVLEQPVHQVVAG